MTDTVLTDEQVASFVEHGHVTIPGCFTREDAQPLLDEAWIRLGYDPHDPDTWEQQRVHMPSLRHVEVRDFAPKVWGAACELLGGEERIEQPYTWGNGFIANLGLGADRDWEPPSASSPGWHKDGDFFRHFLDSPEQGLLTIVLWSDIEPRGGGTFVASDSVVRWRGCSPSTARASCPTTSTTTPSSRTARASWRPRAAWATSCSCTPTSCTRSRRTIAARRGSSPTRRSP